MSHLNSRGIRLGRYDSRMPRPRGAKPEYSGPVTIADVLAEVPTSPMPAAGDAVGHPRA